MDVKPDGSWSGVVPVPAEAKPDKYEVDASCIATDVEPFFFYPTQKFKVD